MNPVPQYGYEYDAWLASACMPASAVRKLLDRYGTSEACHQAVCRNDVELKELISQRFYQVLYSTGAKENLEKYNKVEVENKNILQVGSTIVNEEAKQEMAERNRKKSNK